MTDEEFQRRLSSLPGPPYHEEFEEAAFVLYREGTREQKKLMREWKAAIRRGEPVTGEQRISQALKVVFERTPEGGEFLDAPELNPRTGVLGSMEHFLPQILSEVYPYWKQESLDGFQLFEARKIGPREGVMAGLCILITDQKVTPFEVRLRVAESGEAIEWMECRLGKRGEGRGGMERLQWRITWRRNPFGDVAGWRDGIDWVYKVTFGEK